MANVERKNILICDDDPFILELLRMMLEKEGHHVRTTGICEQSWIEIAEKKPDLIFMDVMIPDAGGEEVTRNLKKESFTKDIKVILISASGDLAETARRCSADGYLEKPFSAQQLNSLLSSAFNAVSMQ